MRELCRSLNDMGTDKRPIDDGGGVNCPLVMAELHSSPEEVAVKVQRRVPRVVVLMILGFPEVTPTVRVLVVFAVIHGLYEFFPELSGVAAVEVLSGTEPGVVPIAPVRSTQREQGIFQLCVEEHEVTQFVVVHVFRVDMHMQPGATTDVALRVESITNPANVAQEDIPICRLRVDLETKLRQAAIANDACLNFPTDDLVSVSCFSKTANEPAHLNLSRDVSAQLVFLELLLVSLVEAKTIS